MAMVWAVSANMLIDTTMFFATNLTCEQMGRNAESCETFNNDRNVWPTPWRVEVAHFPIHIRYEVVEMVLPGFIVTH